MKMRSSNLVIVFVLCALLLSEVRSEDPELSGLKKAGETFETDHWAVEISAGANALELAEKHGHELIGKVGALPGVFVFRQLEDTVHGVTHPHHNESVEILWSEKQIARELSKRAVPTDPLYSSQWHLHDTSSVSNINVNIVGAWNQGLTGEGVRIAVCDDGLEYTHPDIAPNYAADSSWDFNYNDANPFADSNADDHGTSAAGAAGARDNSVCGAGSAFRAQIAAIRILSASTTDYQEASAMSFSPQKNHIYTNSWGPIDDGRRLEGPGRLATAALEQGTLVGRDGKGSIYVWAAGNGRASGDNCNYDGWANSRFTISIGAIDSSGNQAYYSECCSMLLASAPSSGSSFGITTTDLMGGRGRSTGDCRNNFGGTSAAAPIAAGVTALILQRNPELGWRDMQAIILSTARRIRADDPEWQSNGAGYHVSHKYGFGMIDATAAVNLAANWTNLGVQHVTSANSMDSRAIPDGTGSYQSTVNVTESFTVEHVTVYFSATHSRRGDLAINLISPSGVIAKLAETHSDTNANYDWTFGSVFSWGEDSVGLWKLQVADTRVGNAGSVNSWKVTIYGH